MKRTLRYYAVARRADGKIGQLLIIREMDGPACVSKSQQWTGVTYRTNRAAFEDIRRLNCPQEKS
jgi:hypothetical protein